MQEGDELVDRRTHGRVNVGEGQRRALVVGRGEQRTDEQRPAGGQAIARRLEGGAQSLTRGVGLRPARIATGPEGVIERPAKRVRQIGDELR